MHNQRNAERPMQNPPRPMHNLYKLYPGTSNILVITQVRGEAEDAGDN